MLMRHLYDYFSVKIWIPLVVLRKWGPPGTRVLPWNRSPGQEICDGGESLYIELWQEIQLSNEQTLVVEGI